MVHRLRSSIRCEVPRPCGRARAAFTIVELLMAVAIIAILSYVLLPTIDSVPAQRLDSVARILAADLSLARSLAIQYNTNWSIQFDSTNNRYDLVWSGTGTPPPMPDNPHAIGPQTPGEFRVEVARLGVAMSGSNGVQMAGAALKASRTGVTDVTFGPLGSTGPQRSEDTVIWLTAGTGTQTKFSRLTVSWVTGQVWVDPPEMFTSMNQLFQ